VKLAPHIVLQASNWYQNVAIFMQLIACFAKKFAIHREAHKSKNTYGWAKFKAPRTDDPKQAQLVSG